MINGDNDPLGYGYSYPGPHTSLFPLSYGSSRENIDTQAVLTQLVLPDGRLLTFNYNEYGEVAEVVMPTGGKVQYDYAYASALPAGNSAGWETRTVQIPSDVHEIDRAVVARRTYADGSTLESSWSYAYGPQTAPNGTYGCTEVQAHAADNTLVLDQRHFFMTSGRFLTWNGTEAIGTGYSLWSTGLELRGETRDASNVVIDASEQDWSQRAPVTWSYYQSEQIANDNRVNEERKILDDGSVAKVDTFYQANVKYNNPTEVQAFDFDGSLKRRSVTSYVDSSTWINGYDYTSDSIHLLSLPLTQTLYDGNGNQVAQSTNEYDNYANDTNHVPLQDYGAVTQHDSNYGASYLTRGNLTRTGRWLNLTNSFIYSYPRYDDLGNVVSAKDPNGNVASISFADDFGSGSNPGGGTSGTFGATYALPTLITSPPPTPGAPVHTARSQHDFSTGLLTGFKDRNGTITQTFYNDPFDRPTQVKAALGINGVESHAAMYYAPSTTPQGITLTNNDVLTAKDQTNLDDLTLRSWTRTDGFGRTVESWSRDPQGDDEVATIYDPLGRVSKQSNPFRPSLSETPVFSMPAYDLMGRVTTVTSPDNAVVTTAYSGNTATVTDQSGKQRKSVSDALGRVVKVYEAPNDPGYNYLTSYSYDALDDLTSVNQSNQTRTFAYDSLKHLTSAANPESSVINYQYDANGNLQVKTDGRGVSSHISYDALSRITRRWYNGSSSLDQVTNNVPALPSGAASSDEVAYFYDSQSLQSSAPNYSRGYAVGHLVGVTYGSGNSAGDYYGYDALGRQTLKIQQTGAVNYQASAIYNLAGELTTETYPSNRTVTNAYDSAGRTSSVTGYLGDGTQRTYSTGIIYDAASRKAKEQFGTATPVFNKLFYNIRGQLSEIRESTSYTGPTDTTWDRGAIINNYSLQAGCVGASCNATDNNGNLMRQDVYIPGGAVFTQYYSYDSLNRLQSVTEDNPNGAANWKQSYGYDRYGNRTIDQTNTYGTGIPKPNFGVDTNTNRLTAPSGYAMSYDAAGNLINDTFTGEGTRTFDSENRMKQAWANGQWQTYTYDGDGRRVKRNVNGTETWQVYGLGGELLAEYAANANASNPQKEYGYRNGQLLITATAPAGLAANTAPDTKTNALASASPASATESRTTAQSFDLLASIKGLVLRLPGISTDTSASTEAVSDTSTPLFGPSFPYASLNRSALPLMPQSGSAKIAFASNRDGSAQIYSMNTDGSGLSRLTNDAANDESPKWSSNNSRIVFQSDRDNLFSGIADIYVMNADGSGQTRFTNDAADDSAPVWSPDGTKIAFQSARNGVNYQVYVMNADGSGQVNISNSAANDNQPSWSPDGTKIAFASDRDQAGFSSIYVMNANGTSQTRLTTSGAGLLDQQPAWSPDGTKLTFTSTRDSTVVTWTETDDNGGTVTKSKLLVNKEVYVMNANGSAQVRLTNTLENDDSASWSGDGTKIVFRSDRERPCCDPTEQVWVMNPDGSSQVDLSNNALDDHCPSWQHVPANMPPTVSLTSPVNGATFIAPANITLTANASDSDGTVSRVDFYQGATLIGSSTTSPYAISWNNVAAGSYTLTAKATDNLGATTTSAPVNITVDAPPAVSITAPANGATFTAPANITITANASDSDGSISRVDFFQGTTLIGTATTSPYTISWNNVAAGGYTLTARATDNLGASTTSNPVNITVGSPPTVSLTTPNNGANFTAPANVTLTANASSSNGTINRVEFYQGTTLIGTSTASPYTMTWNNVAAGSYVLKARAIDNSSASTDSTPVNISVDAPPTVSVTSPTNGASFNAPANIAITANASDTDGTVSRVDVYQGTTLIGTATASPYNVNWNNVTAGSYSLTAKATDNVGAQTTSTAINITVITTVADVRWIVTDQLGTPRMIFDQTGSLANMLRHDYLPFGEELTAGGRTGTLGYGVGDGARQKFTQKERDVETGLDYFGARYYSSTEGRFTTVDPAKFKAKHFANPQDLNRYAYVANNPLAFFDPDGEEKVKIIIRTFIPEKTVTVPGGVGGDPGVLMPANKVYQGDDRKVGEHPERFRTEQIILIETDRSKNGNGKDIVVNNDAVAGLSRRLFSDGSSTAARAQPKSDARGVYTVVGQDFITVTATSSAGNPLNAEAPPISYSVGIDIFSRGSKGDLFASASGNRNQFPGMEIYIERPETSNQSGQLIYSYNPDDENRGPFSIFRREDFEGHEKKLRPE